MTQLEEITLKRVLLLAINAHAEISRNQLLLPSSIVQVLDRDLSEIRQLVNACLESGNGGGE